MTRLLTFVVVLGAVLSGCATRKPTIPPVASVDLPRFMGDWYVIAHIPSSPERDAWNAVENYRLDDDGRIRTTFRFREGGFDAPLETMEPVGSVVPDDVPVEFRDDLPGRQFRRRCCCAAGGELMVGHGYEKSAY